MHVTWAMCTISNSTCSMFFLKLQLTLISKPESVNKMSELGLPLYHSHFTISHTAYNIYNSCTKLSYKVFLNWGFLWTNELLLKRSKNRPFLCIYWCQRSGSSVPTLETDHSVPPVFWSLEINFMTSRASISSPRSLHFLSLWTM